MAATKCNKKLSCSWDGRPACYWKLRSPNVAGHDASRRIETWLSYFSNRNDALGAIKFRYKRFNQNFITLKSSSSYTEVSGHNRCRFSGTWRTFLLLRTMGKSQPFASYRRCSVHFSLNWNNAHNASCNSKASGPLTNGMLKSLVPPQWPHPVFRLEWT